MDTDDGATRLPPDRLLAVIELQSDVVRQGLDSAAVMALVVERAKELLDADGAVIELAVGDEMVYRAASGIASGQIGLRLKRRGSLSGLWVEHGHPLVATDTETDERVDREACRRVGLRSMLVMPLRHGGEVVGVLKVLWAAPDGPRPEGTTLVELVADLVAASLASAAIHEHDELFRLSMENSAIGTCLVAPDGRFLEVNAALCEILARSPEALMAATWQELTHPDDLETDLCLVQDVLDDRIQSYRLQKRYLRPDGSVVWGDLTVACTRDPGRRVRYFISQIADITAHKEAEQALAASEGLYRSIASTSHEAIFVLDRDRRILAWNEAAARIWGIDEATALSTEGGLAKLRDWQLRREDDSPLPLEELPWRRTMATGQALRDVVLGFRREDERRWVAVSTSPLTAADEEFPHAVAVTASDVTQARAAEAQLAASEQRLRVAADAADLGIWSWDLASETLTWDETLLDWYQVPDDVRSSGLYHAFWRSRVHPDDLAATEALFAAARAGDAVYDDVFRILRPDGEVRYIHSRGVVQRDAAGTATGMLGANQDVTEQRRLEERLRRFSEELERQVELRTAQLEAASRELEAFVYSAAHDLRAPLRAIDGFSQLVAEDAGARLTEAERADLQRVRAAAQRMALLIDHLMALSRAGRQDLRTERVDVTRLAYEVCAEVCGPEPGRELELVVAPGLTAETDAAVLRAVLTDLAENAWKFTAKHDRARIEVGALDSGGTTAFFVRDDGAGFDMAAARHLFGAFQRYHAASDFPGDGIGLATVQRLVARLGGRVWAEAAVEEGATFFFTLGTPAAT